MDVNVASPSIYDIDEDLDEVTGGGALGDTAPGASKSKVDVGAGKSSKSSRPKKGWLADSDSDEELEIYS